jgi:cellulose biosynthesis protein BcsQ
VSKIILFGNQKGGVGKTTLTALCANALSAEPFNRRVCVVDIDPQQSLIRRRLSDIQNSEVIPPYPLEAKTFAQLQKELPELDQAHDLVFVDAAGKLDAYLPTDQQEITKLLFYADFLFVPIVPGNFSLDATLDYLKLALKIKAKRQERPLAIVALVNMGEPRTIDDRYLAEEIGELTALTNIEAMTIPLNRYALYRATDTLTSFYDVSAGYPGGSVDRARANFADWITEFNQIISQ